MNSKSSWAHIGQVIAIGVICLALAMNMSAQVETTTNTEKGQATKQVTVERGEVVMVEGNDLIVKRDDGQILHFPNVPDSTRVTVDGQQLSVHDLKPGMKLQRTITTTTTPKSVTTTQNVTGTVWHVTPPSSVILTLADGTNQQFRIPRGQKFLINGRQVDARDLRRGMTVTATVIVEEPITAVDQKRQITGMVPPPPPAPPANTPILIVVSRPTPAPIEEAAAAPAKLPKGEEEEPNYQVVRIFFATDRALGGHSADLQSFTGERSKADNLTLGAAEISIPRDHRMGQLEEPSFLRFEFREDPTKHVVLLKAQSLNRVDFQRALRNKLNKDKKKQVLVFVHGYNVTFVDGARRLGQMVYDLGFEGAPILYSWPSHGTKRGYAEDEASIEWSAQHFIAFLQSLHQDPDVKTIYLVGHSMGNRLVAAALRNLAPTTPTTRPMFGEVVMAAPDVDEGVFRQSAEISRRTASRITIYESSADEALKLSHGFHGYARVGDTDPTIHVFSRYECIEASALNTSFLGHSYIGDNSSILGDIFDLLTKDLPANERFRLVQHQVGGLPYWAFKK